jgi:hypothetical protein
MNEVDLLNKHFRALPAPGKIPSVPRFVAG